MEPLEMPQKDYTLPTISGDTELDVSEPLETWMKLSKRTPDQLVSKVCNVHGFTLHAKNEVPVDFVFVNPMLDNNNFQDYFNIR